MTSRHWSLEESSPADLAALFDRGVHLIGVAGAGMSGIARLLLDRGVAVTGSDSHPGAALDGLRERGADVGVGHSGDHFGAPGVVVVSSAVRADNGEVALARSAGVPIVHRSAALAALMTGDAVVTVAGTHGKTTTTSMITVAARRGGLDVSYAIGGDLALDGVNARIGTANVFIAEADESDGSFVAYQSDVCVVGNVEADHLDHYGSLAAVEESFLALAGRMSPGGLAIAGVDDPGARRWADAVARQRPDVRVVRVGRSHDCDIVVVDSAVELLPGSVAATPVTGAVLTLMGPGGRRWPVTLRVPGRHNATNAALAWAACVEGLGVAPAAAAAGLESFTGARRRFERRGRAGGVLVVDDYAHHPTEVRAAIAAGRDVAGAGRVHVVFQPHLYSRTRSFAAEFAAALATADTVVALDVYAAREDPEPGVSGALVIQGVSGARFLADRSRAVAAVTESATAGDIILTLGAGDVTELGPQILDALGGAEPDPEPEISEPEATEPEVTEPEVTEPEIAEPEITEPGASRVVDGARLTGDAAAREGASGPVESAPVGKAARAAARRSGAGAARQAPRTVINLGTGRRRGGS